MMVLFVLFFFRDIILIYKSFPTVVSIVSGTCAIAMLLS